VSLARKAAIGFLSFLLFVSLTGLGLAVTAGRTVLNSDFVVSRLDELDVVPLVGDMLKEQVPPEVMTILPDDMIDEVLDDVLTGLEPWLREQLAGAVVTGYDYILSRSDELVLVIDVAPVKEAMKEELLPVLLAEPPPGLDMLPPAQLESLLNQFYEQVAGQIPSTLEINESVINEMGPEIMSTLAQARRYVGYFRIIYWALIISTALFIMGIILLDRRVKSATRWLGIPCLISGVVSYAGTFLIRDMAGQLLSQLELPGQLRDWLSLLVNDSLGPMRIYGIVLIAVGVALLIVSFVHRRRDYDYDYSAG